MSDEWYTPEKYIRAARIVMGSIDLDPATTPAVNARYIQAPKYYCAEDNGLKFGWDGNIFVNPPFNAVCGKSMQQAFSAHLIDQYRHGNTKQAVLLCSAAPDRKWFQPLWQFPICFTNHQILFERPNAKPYHIYHGTVFVYLGPNIKRFKDNFSQFGNIRCPPD